MRASYTADAGKGIRLSEMCIPRMMIEHKLSVVLSVDETDKLLDATDDLRYKVMFATMYSFEMRIFEVV